MLLRLYDISMPSINPTAIFGSAVAGQLGGGSVIQGSATTPGLPYPTIEPIYRVVGDVSQGYATSGYAPVPAGQVLTAGWPAAAPFNYGGGAWTKLTGNNQAIPRFNYGVVVAPPVPFGGPNGTFIQNTPGGESLVCCEGMVAASVTSTAARAPGYLLTSGTNVLNNLSDIAPTAYGQVLAVLAQTSTIGTANFIVKVGGY
jgi:hypothetical protein